MSTYAGIGSRQTPGDICGLMSRIAKYLAWTGWTLRSGGAIGADIAFERGTCSPLGSARGPTYIYLPWPDYNKHERAEFTHSQVMTQPTRAAYTEAQRHHPSWARLTDGARTLHARNCHIVLGENLHSPVDRLILWTIDGGITGGTGQAMRIARKKHIPIHNLHDPQTAEYYERMVKG